ncbi:lytic transglycosylase domain-containing protein [Wenzhouxiangella sp. AB-CW3]|uniref:lytic transglycosylase domain-containing protein n=1 Tax=Wenzhouxiangella sp. AB-CW3 TaxID=2771012 RepID=UPI00168AE868|nr:lytic transglycosylase domain-containing protein [Wenzhouxiangella sp. AB-CW3]QOC22329.1 lytic transglycosylase domain-containing protein [Wenzhouxiangella sp. AB-CW3]
MMKASYWRMVVASLVGLALLPLAAIAQGGSDGAQSSRDSQREVFRQGWAAARRGNQAGVVAAISELDDYPLTPYLEFELLRQRIDKVPEVVMEQFLARHRDWSFAGRLETAWLRSLGRREQWDALLLHGSGSQDTEVRCHVAHARVVQGQHEGLEAEVELLWKVGRSQPDACNPVFSWWRDQGNPSPQVAWERFRLAVDAGEQNLARYLRRYLPASEREWAERWLLMRSRPQNGLRRARHWPDQAHSRLLVSAGVRQLARSDQARARDQWTRLAPRFDFSSEQRAGVERELALFAAVALEEDALEAIDALPAEVRDQQILAWRARVAMAHDRWNEVLASIQGMSVDEQAQSRWRYWRGRALAALNRPDALVAFGTLAGDSNYYGFLAALQLQQPLNLCSEELSPDADVQRRLLRDAEFKRAVELFHVGLAGHGRTTWTRVSRRLSQAELEQAALMAAADGWHDRAIAALNSAGNRRAYPWRFPMAEKGDVLALSRQYRVEPALVYGLMRAESAMQADALSPAGARGLLQLMPATAAEVAGRNGLRYNGQADLMEPAINLPLGIAHLAELQERYDGDWVRVAAAYNAGINAVARWQDSRPATDADVWMETLPFFETRDYVPRVLAFATIYEWQLGEGPSLLARYALGSDAPGPGFACHVD